jgi:hypothetical protein
LRYRRSARPLSINSWTEELPMTTRYEEEVTYPCFLAPPLRRSLLFLYRSGHANRGSLRMKEWSCSDQSWRDLEPDILSGVDQKPWTSNPYWNHPAVGDDGSIHLAFVWRTPPSPGEKFINNINIDYAYSPNLGRDWYSTRGHRLQTPITQVNSETVWAIAPASNLINQSSTALDSRGRPHIVFYSDDPEGIPQYQHLWFDSRVWRLSYVTHRTQDFTLAGDGTIPIPISRPEIVIDKRDRAYMVYRGDFTGCRMVVQRLLPPDYAPDPADVHVLWDEPRTIRSLSLTGSAGSGTAYFPCSSRRAINLKSRTSGFKLACNRYSSSISI